MVASYLATARTFASKYEESESNEFSPPKREPSPYARKVTGYEENEVNEEKAKPRITSSNSFTSCSPGQIHRAKVSALSSQTGPRGDVWCVAIRAGIRYAKEGRVNSEAIQEDIEVWKELAAKHGWPPAPPDLITNEENEFDEERRRT